MFANEFCRIGFHKTADRGDHMLYVYDNKKNRLIYVCEHDLSHFKDRYPEEIKGFLDKISSKNST